MTATISPGALSVAGLEGCEAVADLPLATARTPLAHLFCLLCGPDGQQMAMCGVVGGSDGETDEKCVVCLDLADQPCPRCGALP